MRWRPVLTPGRRRYLEQLADGQPRRISQRGTVGYSLRQLGWCAFAVRNVKTGEIAASKDVRFYADDGTRLYEFLTDPWDGAEIITPEGLRILHEATEGHLP